MPQSLEDSAALATLSSVVSSASSVALLAANNARKGVTVTNDSTAVLYLAYAATATTSAYTAAIPGSSSGVPYVWEMPLPLFRGALSAIWASANGNARVTELT